MTTAATQLDPNQLIRLLEQQRDVYHQLRELSSRQRSVLAGDQPEQLLSVLRQRQEHVATLAKLNEQLAPFRRNWEATYADLPDEHRARASTLLQEINGLLCVILRTDQEDGALLAARKQSVAAELSGISGGQSANLAYARQAGPARGSSAADLAG